MLLCEMLFLRGMDGVIQSLIVRKFLEFIERGPRYLTNV
jgi:hypothetical protein